jgi:hypothetical protein
MILRQLCKEQRGETLADSDHPTNGFCLSFDNT